MFDGARFRISPRSIEGNGIIAKLEYIPKTEIEGRGTDFARLFKKKISKCWNWIAAWSADFHESFAHYREVFQEKDGVGDPRRGVDHQTY